MANNWHLKQAPLATYVKPQYAEKLPAEIEIFLKTAVTSELWMLSQPQSNATQMAVPLYLNQYENGQS